MSATFTRKKVWFCVSDPQYYPLNFIMFAVQWWVVKDQQKQIDQQLHMQPAPQSLFGEIAPRVASVIWTRRHDQFLRQEDMRKRNNMELEEDTFRNCFPCVCWICRYGQQSSMLTFGLAYIQEKRRTLQEQARLDREAAIVGTPNSRFIWSLKFQAYQNSGDSCEHSWLLDASQGSNLTANRWHLSICGLPFQDLKATCISIASESSVRIPSHLCLSQLGMLVEGFQ